MSTLQAAKTTPLDDLSELLEDWRVHLRARG